MDFAGHCDAGNYHGWILAYSASTLGQLAAYVDTPGGTKGGIWQSGSGPDADSNGNVFVFTGNDTFDRNTGGNDFSDSALKLQLLSNPPAPGYSLSVNDWFAPYNQAFLLQNDWDFGSGGTVLLPDQTTGPPHLMVGADKYGDIYLLNRDNLGQYQSSSNSQIVQYLSGLLANEYHGSRAYWQGFVYFAGGDGLKAFQLTNGLLSSSPTSHSSQIFEYPGSTPCDLS